MGKSTTQKTTENSITENRSPQYVQDAAKYLVNTGQNMTQPFLNIPNYRIAGFTPDQEAAQTFGRGIAQAVNQNPNRWGANVAELSRGFGELEAFNPGDAQKWINPFTTNVIDNTRAVMESDYRDKDAVLAASYAAGPVRGSGAALARGQLARGANEAAGTMAARLNAAAYDNANQMALAAKNIRNDNIKSQRDVQLRAQQLGSGLDTEELQRNLLAMQGLSGIGQQQQDQNQRMLDVPWEILSILQGITPQDQTGTSTTQGTKKTTSSGGGNVISGLAGLASIGKSFGIIGCDRSLKTDIEELGVDEESGLKMYAFRYVGDPKTYPKVVGPMADEVEAAYPGSTMVIAGKRVIKVGA